MSEPTYRWTHDGMKPSDDDTVPLFVPAAEVARLQAQLAEVQVESEGRRQELVRASEERRAEWIRAEQAEADRDAARAERDAAQKDRRELIAALAEAKHRAGVAEADRDAARAERDTYRLDIATVCHLSEDPKIVATLTRGQLLDGLREQCVVRVDEAEDERDRARQLLGYFMCQRCADEHGQNTQSISCYCDCHSSARDELEWPAIREEVVAAARLKSTGE